MPRPLISFVQPDIIAPTSMRRARPADIAGWLLQPLVRVFADRGTVPPELLERLRRWSEAERVPFAVAQDLVGASIVHDGDTSIGLRAGTSMEPRLHFYLVNTAQTVADAIESAARYMPLLTNALVCDLVVEGSRATVHLDSSVVLSVTDMAFFAGIVHSAYLCAAGAMPEGLEWRFPHEAPSEAAEYPVVLRPAEVRFGADCFGFSFDSAHLGAVRRTADARLHALFRGHADRVLTGLFGPSSVRALVETEIARALQSSRPKLSEVARALGTTRRTLARRLAADGTSFTQLVDECQRVAALDFVSRSSLSTSEIADRLYLSDRSSFHRMFRRWTGGTPGEYRRQVRAGEGSVALQANSERR